MDNTQLANLTAELKQFSGSETFYKNPLFGGYVYTEGVKYLAMKTECYWLIDYIFSNQILPKLKGQCFQTWKIDVKEDDTAIVTVENGNSIKLVNFKLGYTDFPFEHFTLWLVEKTLLLPQEY